MGEYRYVAPYFVHPTMSQWNAKIQKAKPIPLHVFLRQSGMESEARLCQSGKLSADALRVAKALRSASQEAGAGTQKDQKRCHECGMLGHLRRECPRVVGKKASCGNCGKPQ